MNNLVQLEQFNTSNFISHTQGQEEMEKNWLLSRISIISTRPYYSVQQIQIQTCVHISIHHKRLSCWEDFGFHKALSPPKS
jgi:hypothetical protein